MADESAPAFPSGGAVCRVLQAGKVLDTAAAMAEASKGRRLINISFSSNFGEHSVYPGLVGSDTVLKIKPWCSGFWIKWCSGF